MTIQVGSEELSERLHELLMNFVGAYESFDEIPEARANTEKEIVALFESHYSQQLKEAEVRARIDEWEKFIDLETGENGRLATLKALSPTQANKEQL